MNGRSEEEEEEEGEEEEGEGWSRRSKTRWRGGYCKTQRGMLMMANENFFNIIQSIEFSRIIDLNK